MTGQEEIKHWTTLVERNVGGIEMKHVPRVVSVIMADPTRNFWHCVSVAVNSLDECNCSDCIDKRWRPQYEKV